MPIRFFGQFLVDKGVVSRGDLAKAVELQDAGNLRLGDTALSMGFITEEEIERVYTAQIADNLPFGDMAVKLGVLSTEQLDAVLAEQARSHLHIGQALLKVGGISADDMKYYLEIFEQEQNRYMIDGGDVPMHIAHRGVWKAASHLTYTLFQRVVRIPVRSGPCRLVQRIDANDFVTGMKLQGPGVDARFLLSVSSGIRFRIAEGVLRQQGLAGETDEVLNDSVKEFLNMVCGGIAEKAAEMNLELDVSVPFTVEQAGEGVDIPEDWEGLWFPVHFPTPRERAEFVICV